MLQHDRYIQILKELNKKESVSVNELASKLKVTKDCIRKDLTKLEKQNKLQRIHGGAILKRINPHEEKVNQRKDKNIVEKKEIALGSFKLIKDNTTIFLDISTSSLELAYLIKESNLNLNVFTNMIEIVDILKDSLNIKLVLIGGNLNNAKDGFVGSMAIDIIKRFTFDQSFIGTVGINLKTKYYSTYDYQDGLTKETIINQSKETYILAESIKFNREGNFNFYPINQDTYIITDKNVSNIYLDQLNNLQIRVFF